MKTGRSLATGFFRLSAICSSALRASRSSPRRRPIRRLVELGLASKQKTRIHAIVRRSKGHAQSVIQTGDLIVNLDSKTVEVNGMRVHPTSKEYQILELLALRKGTTLTKEVFLNHLYGGMDEPELKIIDVFICKLRKKLANASNGKNYIETVWGRGYALREPRAVERTIPAQEPVGVRAKAEPHRGELFQS